MLLPQLVKRGIRGILNIRLSLAIRVALAVEREARTAIFCRILRFVCPLRSIPAAAIDAAPVAP